MPTGELKQRIKDLKRKKNAILLVHNYQRPEIQEIADFIGDSLDLSRKAKETEADIIVFAGVTFMAETAKILSPLKKVLMPEPAARCPMAEMAKPDKLKKFAEQYPDAEIVAYVNTTAEIKAMADVCVTSSNAVKVVDNLDGRRIIFIPDKNLATYVSIYVKDKEIIPWDGYCYVHNAFTEDDLYEIKDEHPQAVIISHPECREEVIMNSQYVESTQGMMRLAKELSASEFVFFTEEGLTKRARREIPDKKFYSTSKLAVCEEMKKITLEKIYESLLYERYEVVLEQDIIERASRALNRMLELS
ncbi:MAG TPA: quinolinate synthase NadA [Candidatus Hydrothermia bacterium]|nr:quinolinate synthase NadA [Candidatus Hydrothermae bacterium]MDD3648548.1 quinolinate synthase NadA [Candidatus Hydrothermia bacterium]MDD5572711.1 quinolinate synthase NadA [Candidatus Hydrothermia bacterium]HOK22592.1 quinolinate synthase NadA [Candidatus Hydrothermia bacterium]HOL23299.1 quinolinate synthase NadA [Candidatus Hydrothermia bacterium]